MNNNTSQLYDEGEEQWETKLHLGCGNIYLVGYENIDVVGALADERPDLVKANETSIKSYYGRRTAYTDIHHIVPRAGYVVDQRMCMTNLGNGIDSVDKIVCVQALEHLRPDDGVRALAHWRDLLRQDGILVISVPDTSETVEMLLDECTRDFAIQHLAGTRTDQHSYHRSHFTQLCLSALLTLYGYREIEFLPNFHRYPAIVVRAIAKGSC